MANESNNIPNTTTQFTPQPLNVDTTMTSSSQVSGHTEEAKSRFNAALEEAKAGASALKDEAANRVSGYREQVRDTGEHWSTEARGKAGDFAVEGKAKASGALLGLSRLVDENVATIEQNLGPQYGDYARNASRSLRSTAESLERKSVEELGEDARTFVRDQPAAAVGMAALAGFLVSRIFRT